MTIQHWMLKDDIATRFWSKVNKTEDCWLWLAYKNKKGYGQFTISCIYRFQAHRYAWIMTNGDITKGLCVLHKCDVPSCVNPSHLFLGTIADNNADMKAKGRRYKGTKLGIDT